MIIFEKRGSYLGNFWANVRRDPPPPTPPLDEDAITDAEEAGKFKHPLRLPLRIRNLCKMFLLTIKLISLNEKNLQLKLA